MISSLVSSILSNGTAAATAEQAAARQAEEDTNRPAMATVIAAKPVASQPIDAIVDQSGPADRTDYFHAAKHMLGKALGSFRSDLRDAAENLGFDEKATQKLTEAVMKQTKNALLWGVGFSVRLMSATLSQTGPAGASAPSFSIAARSIEITVNHSTGIIDVEAQEVSVRSQSTGMPGEADPHLLDIRDTEDDAPGSLLAVLQALNEPEALFEDDDDRLFDESVIDRALPKDADEPVEKTDIGADEVPLIDTPAVLNRPGYGSRIMIAEMTRTVDANGDRLTFMRLDAIMPLTDRRPAPATGMIGQVA